MIHSSAWLGSGVGAGMVLVAACVGVARGPVAPVPGLAVPGTVVAAVPGPDARRGFAPACAAMHRSGTCLAAGHSPTRLLRT